MRHAETVDNAARVWQGHRDSALSERGVRQVAAAAPHVAAYAPVVIVSSDLRRAVSTAAAVGELTGLPVRLDARLREVHVGEWQGLHVDDVHERYPDVVAALDRGEDVPKGVTGETRQDVAARAGAVLRGVADGLGAGETALVVAHGVSGRVAASDLVGLDQDVSDRVFRGLDNCHWIELVEAGKSFSATARWRIAGWNLGPWKD
jgi:probable phosphoglycerate mutase